MPRDLRPCAAAIFLAALFSGVHPAHAIDTFWNSESGILGSESNWLNNVKPSFMDTAIFNYQPETFQFINVVYPSEFPFINFGELFIRDDHVNFDLFDGDIDVARLLTIPGQIGSTVIGHQPGDLATFHLQRGLLRSHGGVEVGSEFGSTGQLIVDAEWQITGHINIGRYGLGNLFATELATITSDDAVIGAFANSPTETSNGAATLLGPDVTWNNSGNFVVGNQGPGTLAVQSQAKLTTADASVGSEFGLPASANISGAGSRWDVTTNLTIGPATDPNAAVASVTVASGARLTVADTLHVGPVGQFQLSGGRATVGTGPESAANNLVRIHADGTLSGSGDVLASVLTDGTTSPGDSAGALHITQNYTQSTSATLSIELGGTTPGTHHDQLVIDGTADFAGTLEVQLIDDFDPNVGETFEIATFASAVGDFASYSGVIIEDTIALVPQFNATNLTLVAAHAGDVNGDGAVDGLDANLLTEYWLNPASYAEGDANLDGVVNGLDANLLTQNWLVGVVAAPIPEPTALALALLAVASLLTIRRRPAP